TSAAGNLLIQSNAGSVTLGAAVNNTVGHTSINAGQAIVQNASITASASMATVELHAAAGSLTMADGSSVQTNAGNIRLNAAFDITVGVVDARSATGRTDGGDSDQSNWASVSLYSTGGSILDNATEATAGNVDVYAKELRLQASTAASSVGQTSNHLELEIAKFSANAGTGGLFLTESSAITVGETAAVETHRVIADATVTTPSTTDAIQSDLMSAGAAVLVTLAGNITIDEGDFDAATTTLGVQAAGNILLQAGAAGGNSTSDLILNADLIGSGGHISLNASQDILQNADITAGTNAKTIDLLAGRDITMSQDFSGANTTTTRTIGSANGHISLSATRNITIETVLAGTGNVRISTGAALIDGDADGDSGVDIFAAGLQIVVSNSTGALGTSANHIETSVGTLSALSGSGGIYITETDAVAVDAVSVTVQRVDNASAVAAQSNTQSDLTTVNGGNIVLVAKGGTLTLNDGAGTALTAVSANGAGNILLDAQGALSNVVIKANVLSGTGHITVSAANQIEVGQGATAASVSTSTGGTIHLLATSGAILMLGASNVTATASSLRLAAGTSVALGNLTANNVSVKAGSGSITNAAGSSKNVSATNLRLEAGQAIGTGLRHISTAVGTLSALSSGASSAGIYVTEDDAITVDAVAVTVTSFTATAGTSSVTDVSQSDLATAGSNGHIVMVTTNGSITLNDANANGYGVSAHGSGNVLLQAGGAGSDVLANVDVKSGTGHITVIAADAVDFVAGADILTNNVGSIHVQATAGSVTMADTSQFNTNTASVTGGSIRILAAQNVTLGGVWSEAGDVSITATAGSIWDGGNTYLDVKAAVGGLRLVAGTGVGTLGVGANALDVQVATVTGRAGTGGISLNELDDVTVGDVQVSVSSVSANGATSTITDIKQADLATVSGSNGAVVLVAGNNIQLVNGSAGSSYNISNTVVSADGSGNVLLQATSGQIDAQTNAAVRSGSGHISMLATSLVQFAVGANVVTTLGGTIDVSASTGTITQAASNLWSSGTGSIRANAAVNVTVGNITTGGQVSITATAGSILDADSVSTVNDADQDITASRLRLNAGTGIGASINHLETTVRTLSASAGNGSIYLLEADALTVDDVSLSVNRVGSDATTGT
ncbi:MAG: hypothetical protein KKF42_09050, partial [Actinobacteria bacterium]|nr:hypothetical protein [Actinomycetota bacterium]